MKRSKRVLILALLVEILLISGGIFLASQIATISYGDAASQSETRVRVLEVAGGATVALAVLFGVLYLTLRRKGH
jgi:hypothetical protein